jgi:hypothetical protein
MANLTEAQRKAIKEQAVRNQSEKARAIREQPTKINHNHTPNFANVNEWLASLNVTFDQRDSADFSAWKP